MDINLASNTTLNDRILWFDGDTTPKDSSLKSMQFFYNHILSGNDVSDLCVTEITPEVNSFNKKNPDRPIKIKTSLTPFNHDWNIPDEYKSINYKELIINLLEDEILSNSFSLADIEVRVSRVKHELQLWGDNNLVDLLRTLIYIVDVFTMNNVVWGTGRGSSCCCYILYLLGLHDVDSVFYDLEITEFFRK